MHGRALTGQMKSREKLVVHVALVVTLFGKAQRTFDPNRRLHCERMPQRQLDQIYISRQAQLLLVQQLGNE